MRPTKDRVFLDSNILIYSYSSSEPGKQSIARKLISENYSIIGTQVLQEFVNALRANLVLILLMLRRYWTNVVKIMRCT